MEEKPFYTQADIDAALSTDKRRLLVVVRDVLHDVTAFAPNHPGGSTVFATNNGTDVSDVFQKTHGPRAAEKLRHWALGPFRKEPPPSLPTTPVAVKTFTFESIHSLLRENRSRLLLVLFGGVYDVTHFGSEHPGGYRVLENNNGKECGHSFMRIHSLKAKKSVRQYYVGQIEGTIPAESPLTAVAVTTAQRPKFSVLHARLQSTRILSLRELPGSPPVRIMTLSCPSPLHLLPGGHIRIYSNVATEESKPYTPYSMESTSFQLCVRCYPKGRTSSYLFSLREGSEVLYDGPYNPAWLASSDPNLKDSSLPEEEKHVLLLAGGTGISPLYTIAKNLLAVQAANVTLVAAVRTVHEVLLVEELEDLTSQYHSTSCRLSVCIALSQGLPSDTVPWAAQTSVGRLDVKQLERLRKLFPATTLAAVLCGPPAFQHDLSTAVVAAGLCSARMVHIL